MEFYELLTKMGYKCIDKNEFKKAEFFFVMSLNDNHNQFLVWYNLGIIFMNYRSMERAMSCFWAVIRLNQNYLLAWGNLGRIYLSQHQLEYAKHCYNQAIKIDPMDATSWNNLGIIYEGQNNIQQAIFPSLLYKTSQYRKHLDLLRLTQVQ